MTYALATGVATYVGPLLHYKGKSCLYMAINGYGTVQVSFTPGIWMPVAISDIAKHTEVPMTVNAREFEDIVLRSHVGAGADFAAVQATREVQEAAAAAASGMIQQ